MEARTIVAIEIASSKIKGAVACAEPGGGLHILAVETLPAVNSVRHGRVQNIREVSTAVNDIIRKLENSPEVAPRKVQTVALSLGGRSLAGIPATATLQFPREIEVTEQTIRRLENEAEKDFVGNKNLVAKIARNFFVNGVMVKPAVGTVGSSLRGDFLMLTCARENMQNLDRLKFDSIRAGNLAYILRPTAVADLVLTDDERQLGCVMVDFGAETTTVTIYRNSSLAFLATIPMGSRLITMDLMAGLTLTESAAEDFKRTLGSLTEQNSNAANATEVNNYVRARAGEIAANIVHQIELSEIATSELGAGIVLTGGGAKLPGFGRQLAEQSKLPLRNADMPDNITFASAELASTDNIDVAAILASAAATTDLEGLSPMPEEETVQLPVTAGEHHDTAIREAEPESARNRQPKWTHDEEDDPRLLTDDGEEDPDDYDDDNSYRNSRPAPDKKKNKKDKKYRARHDDNGDDMPDDEPEANVEVGRVKRVLQSVNDSIARLFGPVSDDEDDDDDDDYFYDRHKK